ncbi:MAG: extracellular solute-binding protein [Anaerolineales bacterium]|nr:extracellular solute-binding protein [Anaerolineales bacterium]MDW8162211.1 extracellular solute-binding protein [Anaerolineales bacterium]
MKAQALLFVLLSIFLITACAREAGAPPGTAPATETTALPAETVTLRVINWNGYGSDESFVLEEFGKKLNVKIEHDYINSEEEILTKLRTSPATYDAILPNVAYLQIAMQEGLIEPIDTSRLQNWEKLLPRFRDLPGLRDASGAVYGVPWVWGATAIAYNTEKFPGGIQSIQALWDPANKGQVGIFDSFEDAVVFAGLALGDRTPYQPDDLQAVKQKLMELLDNVKTLWASEDEFNKLFANGDITLGNYWSGAAARAAKMGLPMAFVVPPEGALGWIDTWAIPKNAPHKDLAYQWLDYMISPEFYLTWDSVAGAPAPTTQASLDALPEDHFNRAVMGDPEVLARLVFMETMTPETREEWNRLWEEVKAGH